VSGPARRRALRALAVAVLTLGAVATTAPAQPAPPSFPQVEILGSPAGSQLARMPSLPAVTATLGGRPRMEPSEYMGPAGNRYGAFVASPGFIAKVVSVFYLGSDELFATIVAFDSERSAAAAVEENARGWGTAVAGTTPGATRGGARYWAFTGSEGERRLSAVYAVPTTGPSSLLRVLCEQDAPTGGEPADHCATDDLLGLVESMVQTPAAVTLTPATRALLPATPPAGTTPILATTAPAWPAPAGGRAPAHPVWSWLRASGVLMRALPEPTLLTQSVATADPTVTIEAAVARVTNGGLAREYAAAGCAERPGGCRTERLPGPVPGVSQLVSLGPDFTELYALELRAVHAGRLLVLTCETQGGYAPLSREQIDTCLSLLPGVARAYLPGDTGATT